MDGIESSGPRGGVPRGVRGAVSALIVVVFMAGGTPAGAAPSGAAPTGTTADAPDGAGVDRFRTQLVEWNPCAFDADVECGAVAVPLDYTDPGGEAISVAVSRQRASDLQRRRGVLFFNPGGPGGSGVETPAGASAPKRALADTPLSETYDLIGFDPRGVGRSSPLRCGDIQLPDVFSRPDAAQFDAFADWAERQERSCAAVDGDRRAFFSTRNTARDMDVVRSVLHEERLNYLGYSYGTYLGAVYGTMFPDRLDRSVLDSAMSPGGSTRASFTSKSHAERANVERWAAWTADRDGVYGLGRTPHAVLAVVEAVSARVDGAPVDGWDRTLFDLSMGDTNRWSMWDEIALRVGALARDEAPGGAVEAAAEAQQEAEERLVDEAFYTILAEADWPADVERYRSELQASMGVYSYGFGPMGYLPLPPAFRSFTPQEPLTVIAASVSPGLVIQAEGDVQTPYAGGAELAERLGSTLISVDEGRHGQYGQRQNACVDEPATAYLVSGALPSGPVSCPGTDLRPAVAMK